MQGLNSLTLWVKGQLQETDTHKHAHWTDIRHKCQTERHTYRQIWVYTHTHTHTYGIIAETHIFWPFPFSTNHKSQQSGDGTLQPSPFGALFSSSFNESTRKLKSDMSCLKAHHTKPLGKWQSYRGEVMLNVWFSDIFSAHRCRC